MKKKIHFRQGALRKWVQSLSALAVNAHLKGFFTGKIDTGPLKHFCVPGLNCYSCPGAVGACPIGAIQAVVGSRKGFPFLVVGWLALLGVLLGRFVCGWLCLFGLVQELLYKLKEEGYEFPGRMRDHVAEACNISRSKLARLKVIREQLLPALLPLWEQGKLNEDMAYKLAQCPQDLQQTLAEVRGNDFRGVYGWWTENLRKAVDALDEIKTCPATDGGTVCTNRERMVRRMCKAQPYTDLCSAKCCLKCSSLDTCKAACAHCADLKAKHKAEAKAKAAEDQAAFAARQQPVKDYHDAVLQRVDNLMRCKEIAADTLDQAADAPGQYYRSTTNIDYLPVGNWLRIKDAMDLIRVAEVLGVTLDFLLAGKAPADRWHTEPPTKPCEVLAYVSIAGAGKLSCTLRWDGEQWLNASEPIDKSVKVTAWITPPGGDDQDADC